MSTFTTSKAYEAKLVSNNKRRRTVEFPRVQKTGRICRDPKSHAYPPDGDLRV